MAKPFAPTGEVVNNNLCPFHKKKTLLFRQSLLNCINLLNHNSCHAKHLAKLFKRGGVLARAKRKMVGGTRHTPLLDKVGVSGKKDARVLVLPVGGMGPSFETPSPITNLKLPSPF